MKINRSSREPGGQASNWRPPGNQNQCKTGNECQNEAQNQKFSRKTSEILVLPSSDQQRDPNQNDNRHKFMRNIISSRHRRIVTRQRLFNVISLTIVLFVALFARAQSVEDFKTPLDGYDFDFGRRVIAREPRLPEIIPQQPSMLEALKASRVRKRNFSVPLPSERTLDIRDAKKENQLEQDRGKPSNGGFVVEEDTRNPLFPAPPFTTFRTTPVLSKRTNITATTISKSSDWIPLLPTEPTEPKRDLTFSHVPTQQTPSSTSRTTLIVKRNFTSTQHPPTQELPEVSTLKNLASTTSRSSNLSEVSTFKSSTSRLEEASQNQSAAVAESNISIQTSIPETSELPFGSRTTTQRLTSSQETPTSTGIITTFPTQSAFPEETSSAKSSTTTTARRTSTTVQLLSTESTSTSPTPIVFGSRTTAAVSTTATTTTVSTPVVFGSRTTAAVSTTAATSTTSKEQLESSSSVRSVLKRPPTSFDLTTRSKPHTTEPIKEEAVTPNPETTTSTATRTTSTPPSTTPLVEQQEQQQQQQQQQQPTGQRTRVRMRDSIIGRFQGSVPTNASSSVQPKNANAARSFARNLDEVNAPEDTNDKSLQLNRIVEGIIGVENETGGQRVPPSGPDNFALGSDKRSSLVRTRTTTSKFLTAARKNPEQPSSTVAYPTPNTPNLSTTTTTTTTTVSIPEEELQEDIYTDKRVAELALSGPEYPSTERELSFESETVLTDFNEKQSKDVYDFQGTADEGSESSTPVVERPAGLQKELLAAIRRKITQNRSNVTTKAPAVLSTTTTTVPQTEPAKTRPDSSFENNDVSPESNIISSTQHPSFFKPIPFPSDQNKSGSGKDSGEVGSNPRVQFFVRVPNSKPGSQVKIPDISHIQGKLARLNAAITEGLQEQRKQQDHDLVNSTSDQEQQVIQAAPSTTTTSAISPTTEPSNEESLMVLTSTSISSIYSVVTGSSHIKAATTSTASTTSTTATTTAPATQISAGPTSATPIRAGEVIAPRLSLKERGYEADKNVEATSKASSVSEIITIGKNDLRNTEAATEKPVEPRIAQKTHTYLDRLRESRQQPSTVQTTITTTTTTASTTAATPARTSTLKNKPLTTKKQQVYEIEPKPRDHPSSHFRPEPDLPVELKTKDRVEIVTPSIGDYQRASVLPSSNSSDTVGASKEDPIQDVTGTTIYVVGVICVIPAAGLVAWVVRYVVRKKDLSNSESGSETGLNCPASTPSDEDALAGTVRPQNQGTQTQHGQLVLAETDSADLSETTTMRDEMALSIWHIPRKNLHLQTVLGEGNFGKVWKAEAEDICGFDGTVLVAVKTTKENAPEKEKTDLLQEMKVMQTIGHHPNVVTLLGVCTEKEPYLLVMEYVMHGKLLTHLREQRSRQVSLFQFTEADLQGESGDQARISSKDLTKYAYGVAKGMEYLVSKGIIHRDLAARNILVDHNRSCKISDFGLSRNLGDTGSEMYEQKTKGALPIRWMSPESLYFSVFTPKSDVWSFGILMWEIVTLGSTPYPGMGAREVMRRVRDGYRLERPSHCHPELYKIISKCWAGDMNKRPDFTELRQELAKLLEDQHGYIDLYNIPENKYYSMTQSSNEEEKL